MVDEIKEEVKEEVKEELSDREKFYDQIKEDSKKTDPNEDLLAELENIQDEEEDPKPEPKEDPKPEPKEDPKEDPKPEPEKESKEKSIAEILRQRRGLDKEEVQSPKVDAKNDENKPPPTIEEVEDYILQVREKGINAETEEERRAAYKEEIAANRYLIQREKEAAISEIEAKRNQEAKAIQDNQQKINQLVADYTTDDSDSPYNLSNTKSKLYQTAMELYQDKTLRTKYYGDEDKVSGFRRAVADAYKELKTLEENGKINFKAKKEPIQKIERNDRIKSELGSPGAESAEEINDTSTKLPLTDIDKVKQEILDRKKFKNQRMKVPS